MSARGLVLLAALALGSCVPLGGFGGPAPGGAPDEVRALWVVRTTLTSPERIRAMVEAAHGAGFNTLIVQVRGRGDAFYRSGVEPRAEALWEQPEDFDPLALMLDEAHARGLGVHAWVNTFLVWDTPEVEVAEGHLLKARPDLAAVPLSLVPRLRGVAPEDPAYLATLRAHARENPELVEGLYASPADPDVHAHLLRVLSDLAERYPLDGVHLDYVRYPNTEYDYSPRALSAFREQAAPTQSPARVRALDEAARSDPAAWTRALPEAWAAHRREGVTAFVRAAAGRLRSLRPDLTVSAAVFPDAEEAERVRFQSWGAWTREGLLDVVAPMAYDPDGERFREQIDAAVRVAGRRRVWAGIGAWQDSLEGTTRKIDVARRAGAAGFSLFSYDWMAEQPGRAEGGTYLEEIARRAFTP